MSKEQQPRMQSESEQKPQTSFSSLRKRTPDTLTNMERRAQKLKEIVRDLEDSQKVTNQFLSKEFDV